MRNIQMRLINTGAFQRLAVLCTNLEAFVAARPLSMDGSHNRHLIIVTMSTLTVLRADCMLGSPLCVHSWNHSVTGDDQEQQRSHGKTLTRLLEF